MPNTDKDQDLKFEQALKILESIADKLNSGVEDLDELLRLYEQGIHYMKICREKLAEAELKVQVLTEKLNKEIPLEEENG
jgi:exodeoxyribonuclease VII small subunit